MSKQKVAFFGEILIKHFDGASRTMFQIIDRIPRKEFDFLFFCGVGPEEDFGYKVIDMPAMPIPFNNTYKMAFPFLHLQKIYKALDKFQPDAIHISSPSPLGNVALSYAEKHNIPTIGIYHTHFISYIDYYLERVPMILPSVKKQVVKGQRKFYNRLDHLYVPTQQMISELDSHGFESNNMVLWQRGLDHTVFNPRAKDENLLNNITGNNRPNIIFASRLVWEKNLNTLANIYNESKNKKIGFNFIIVGDGVANEKLRELMPSAYFLGKVSQKKLAALYASSDVFIFPSITETYGNVVVEAMASGCPCVIAAGGGSQAHITNNVNGFLCDPNDTSQYLDYIQAIIYGSKLSNRLKEGGYEYTRELDWDRLCNRYFLHLQSITNKTELKISA